MGDRLVECVPNFSEGRDREVIDRITGEIGRVDGARLLDVDPGFEMNRTVVTFVGSPEAVEEAAFRAIRRAAELIDMSRHHGSHPRMGATDVCPFVPVSGMTEEECVRLSERVAKRVGDELRIPVYLYEKSARRPERRNLAMVRSGEYEGLEKRLKTPEGKPDFGPAVFNARSGATAIGVREFLIAWNINLNTREPLWATDIAFDLREKGRSVRRGNTEPFYLKGREILKYAPKRYPCGSCDLVFKTIGEAAGHCRDEHGYDLARLLRLHDIDPEKPDGESVKRPGKFTHCKAIGWMVPEYGRAQISINMTDYKVTPLHAVYDEARRLAERRGLVVTGSEIVGMVPVAALLDTGRHYLRGQGRSTGIPVRDVLETAVQSLGLRDVGNFDIDERVLGLPKTAGDDLAALKVHEFVDEVSRESPAPGGGSIAALAGALGAALASMVSNLSIGRRGTEEVEDELKPVADRAQELKDALVRAVDADSDAFNAYMEARRLPAASEEEKRVRQRAIQDGLKRAIAVPLDTARRSAEAIDVAAAAAEKGNINSVTDAGIGAHIAFTGVRGGIFNVLINLKEIDDAEFVEEMRSTCRELEAAARKKLAAVMKMVESKIDRLLEG